MSRSDDSQLPRRSNGQFAPGVSGNSKGRPRSDRRIPHPNQFRDALYDIAEYKVPVKLNGKAHQMPLVYANILPLGVKGASGDAIAARSFIAALRLATDQEARQITDLTRRFEGVEPAYVTERNPQLRAELKRVWEEVVAELSGARTRKGGVFPPPKRKRPRP